jgi:ferric-dicitrate binding protein FerR (iron transport regulator)
MSDHRRLAELAELFIDGELSADEAAELRARLASEPAAMASLRASTRDHQLCRTALRPNDGVALAGRTRRMLEAWRPASGETVVRGVFDHLDRRRRWAAWRYAASVAVAALLLILLAPAVWDLLRRPVLRPDAGAPRLTEAVGAVRSDSDAPLAVGDRLAIGTGLVSAGGATLVWPDGSRLTLGPGGALARLAGPGQRVRLERGTLRVRAAHRPADAPLEVVCPDATARVVGTAFTVSVSGGRSRLVVDDGLVRWRRASDGASSLLGAGQQATATVLPLPRALLLPSDQLAAVRDAIAAGREPWASSWAALDGQVPGWLAAEVPALRQQDAPGYYPGNAAHTAARTALYRLTLPAVGLALAARLRGDQACARSALAWLRAVTSVRVSGGDAATLVCDTLAVHGLQAADLLRGLPSWTAAEEALIGEWIARELVPRAEEMRRETSMGSRWRGTAATMAIAAWHGDHDAVRTAMAELREEIPLQLSREKVARLVAQDDSHPLHQALNHALLCADIARCAIGDSAAAAGWQDAVGAFIASIASDRTPNGQALFFHRALVGPGPWRSPAAGAAVVGADPLRFCYGWYFPTLTARDPRWP